MLLLVAQDRIMYLVGNGCGRHIDRHLGLHDGVSKRADCSQQRQLVPPCLITLVFTDESLQRSFQAKRQVPLQSHVIDCAA